MLEVLELQGNSTLIYKKRNLKLLHVNETEYTATIWWETKEMAAAHRKINYNTLKYYI